MEQLQEIYELCGADDRDCGGACTGGDDDDEEEEENNHDSEDLKDDSNNDSDDDLVTTMALGTMAMMMMKTMMMTMTTTTMMYLYNADPGGKRNICVIGLTMSGSLKLPGPATRLKFPVSLPQNSIIPLTLSQESWMSAQFLQMLQQLAIFLQSGWNKAKIFTRSDLHIISSVRLLHFSLRSNGF